MEKLKSLVPAELGRMIAESSPDDLPSTCSTLLDFFHQTAQFHRMIKELVDTETSRLCGKNKTAALELKRKGNDFFSKAQYDMALSHYSQALRAAPSDAHDLENNLVVTLYVNRASSLFKIGLLRECLRDCNRALLISPGYAKAWYRRGKTNSSLESYEYATHDLEIALKLELSVSGKRQIQSELQAIREKLGGTNSSLGQENGTKSRAMDEPRRTKLQCVYTQTKGRGMTSETDIAQASLIHTEEPYAMVILKHCRETHCHFCLNELPADIVPCTSCSIPLYCSQDCQARATGRVIRNYPKSCGIHKNLSGELEQYVAQIVMADHSDLDVQHLAEHRHECQGVHWPRVLPSELVLAGRVLVKSIYQRNSTDSPDFLNTLDLSHNYSQMPPEKKMELHIYSIVLLKCLQQSCGPEVSINGHSISQVVILISQIKVNSMAIVRMKFLDVNGGVPTSNVEQVRVGQAIYLAGSRFNHSCQPNIHVYFLSRTLLIQSTESVAAWTPLELSYGPQVGQWDCKDRQQFLQDEYSFECHCRGCSELNLSDLVLNAFRCVDPDCFGVVLDSYVVKYEAKKVDDFEAIEVFCSKPSLQEVACHALKQANGNVKIEAGYCLKCGSSRDLASSLETVNEAGFCIRRLHDAIDSRELPATTLLSDALRSLDLLRSTLHRYNKRIAEVEDILAQAFCFVGDFQTAIDHCKASIKILEKLYDPNHIVIGYELLKLSSIQLICGDCTSLDGLNRLSAIFSRYYGSHSDIIFPHLQTLKKEVCKLGL